MGTGHAVMQALPHVAADAIVLVLLGDVPLIERQALRDCVSAARQGLALVSTQLAQPNGFGGRILRRGGQVVGIVEEPDASSEQLAIGEVNAGTLAAPRALLAELLDTLTPNNVQGELYLTDVVAAAAERDVQITGVRAGNGEAALGINDRSQLARLERHFQRQQAAALMAAGVALMDPERLDVRGRVSAGMDCCIDVNVVLEGDVALGEGVRIGAGSIVRDSRIGDGAEILPMSCIDGATVGPGCRIGPYARLRPGSVLGADVRIGNFVEVKQAELGAGSKANHLAYLGDATVGAGCNIGAGAVTCNYDGVDKHRTEIGDGVFVGTNATLVAPLAIDGEAYVGAGSTITAPVKRGELAIGRARQRNVQGWTPPAKRRKGR